MNQTMDAGLTLLDHQVVDADGRSVGKVDDLLFETPAGGGPPELVAITIGQQAYGRRLGGRLGRYWAGLARRLSQRDAAADVPVELIDDIGVTIRLGVSVEALPDLERAERWLRDAVIGKIPGAQRESG